MKYEIKICGVWTEVTKSIFRSWTGPRKLNGKKYKGKVFWYLSNKLYKQHEK